MLKRTKAKGIASLVFSISKDKNCLVQVAFHEYQWLTRIDFTRGLMVQQLVEFITLWTHLCVHLVEDLTLEAWPMTSVPSDRHRSGDCWTGSAYKIQFLCKIMCTRRNRRVSPHLFIHWQKKWCTCLKVLYHKEIITLTEQLLKWDLNKLITQIIEEMESSQMW